MAAFREEMRPEYKVVWTVFVTKKPVRTDQEVIHSSAYEVCFIDEQSQDLFYCEDAIVVDIGHSYVKNIEVKKVTTMNASNIAKNIHRASGQISNGDTVALYFEGRKSTADNRSFVSKGVDEARRKGYIKGPVEVWFSDKTKITY
jgi:hypothetical protein